VRVVISKREKLGKFELSVRVVISKREKLGKFELIMIRRSYSIKCNELN